VSPTLLRKPHRTLKAAKQHVVDSIASTRLQLQQDAVRGSYSSVGELRQALAAFDDNQEILVEVGIGCANVSLVRRRVRELGSHRTSTPRDILVVEAKMPLSAVAAGLIERT
jgi:hypothetical protein